MALDKFPSSSVPQFLLFLNKDNSVSASQDYYEKSHALVSVKGLEQWFGPGK